MAIITTVATLGRVLEVCTVPKSVKGPLPIIYSGLTGALQSDLLLPALRLPPPRRDYLAIILRARRRAGVEVAEEVSEEAKLLGGHWPSRCSKYSLPIYTNTLRSILI